MSDTVPQLVEHLFRQEAGKLISSLTRRLGISNIDLAEEAVQDALVRALKVWTYHGIPPNPAGWLNTTANNAALDKLRRRKIETRVFEHVAGETATPPPTQGAETELDDQLAMMFACCHPSLNEEAQIALTLKAVCGFATSEIARAFLAEEPTIAQRIVRAKRLLRDESVPIAVPPPIEIPERLDSVLQVLYLLFNEGYSAFTGDDLVRHDLCQEALRLGRLLTQRPDTARPKVHALVALMFFHASRLPARVDGAGDLLRLGDQDRAQWDPRFVFAGLRHLDAASAGNEFTRYHLEAGIAAIHAQAPSDDATNWPQVLWLYDQLVQLTATPVVKLNRAVAVMRVHGVDQALSELEPLAKSLDRYYLFHSVRADLLRRCNRMSEAVTAYERALACPCCNPERRFIQAQLQQVSGATSARRGIGPDEKLRECSAG
jgi:RNA polymerase sigma-70 factor (ECF subfamily)